MMRFNLTLLSLMSLTALLLATTSQAQTLDGTWRSDGDGMVYDVKDNHIRAFELTSVSRILSWEVNGKADPAKRGSIFFTQDGCALRLSSGADGKGASIQSDCSVADILLHRTEPLADKPVDRSPQACYDIFWHTYAENYPFFKLHHIDWAAIDRQIRPRVTAKTSPKELYNILQGMIEPLHDAHTSLNAPKINRQFKGSRPDTKELQYDDIVKSAVIDVTKYVRGETKYFCKNQIGFGTLDGQVGYLKIWSFIGYSNAEDYASQSKELETALDTIFHDSDKLKGLVIDVRNNGGGYDGLGLSIAERLASQDYLGYSVETRDNLNGPIHFTKPQSVQVRSSTKPGFHGNVVVLMGPQCVSAGETFVMSLMGRKPHVQLIGENTQGVFSDVLMRKLPNGWTFGLPNQIYLTEGGKSFDGAGIAPDMSLPIFPPEELKIGRDSAIEKALETLGNQH